MSCPRLLATRCGLPLILWACLAPLVALETDSAPTNPQPTFQTGTVTIDGRATLELPDHLCLLSPADARHVLMEQWGNTFCPAGMLGLIVPASLQSSFITSSPPTGAALDAEALPTAKPIAVATAGAASDDDTAWGMVITWTDGHIQPTDLKGVNFTLVLHGMQLATHSNNRDRFACGYPAIALLAWAEPPHYDSQRQTLTWATASLFSFDQWNPARPSFTIPASCISVQGRSAIITYSACILGAKGTLRFDTIARPRALANLSRYNRQILERLTFTPGNAYADFQQGHDSKSDDGIVQLIAGPRIGNDRDPGNLRLTTLLSPALWWGATLALIGLIVALVRSHLRGTALFSLTLKRTPPSQRPPPTTTTATTDVRRCPNCKLVLHQDSTRCRACGASAIERTPPRS